MTQEEQEKLRKRLFELRNKREELIMELGLYAQENQDLRENSAYINTERKIQLVSAQIHEILLEFGKWELAKMRSKRLNKVKKATKTSAS